MIKAVEMGGEEREKSRYGQGVVGKLRLTLGCDGVRRDERSPSLAHDGWLSTARR